MQEKPGAPPPNVLSKESISVQENIAVRGVPNMPTAFSGSTGDSLVILRLGRFDGRWVFSQGLANAKNRCVPLYTDAA